MRLVERAREPRVVSTIDVLIFETHMKIPEDLSTCWIFGDYLRSPVQKPLRLDEIDCRFNIRWNEDRRLTKFWHDIDLNGEQHGNSRPL